MSELFLIFQENGHPLHESNHKGTDQEISPHNYSY